MAPLTETTSMLPRRTLSITMLSAPFRSHAAAATATRFRDPHDSTTPHRHQSGARCFRFTTIHTPATVLARPAPALRERILPLATAAAPPASHSPASGGGSPAWLLWLLWPECSASRDRCGGRLPAGPRYSRCCSAAAGAAGVLFVEPCRIYVF